MKKTIIPVLLLLVSVSALAQRPGTLNRYDRNAPFGWALFDDDLQPFSLTGGAGGESITLTAVPGKAMNREIQKALHEYSIVILDGSQGEFLVDGSGILLNSHISRNKTVVGINGAVIKQMNSTAAYHSYFEERFKEVPRKKHCGNYVNTRKWGRLTPERVKWLNDSLGTSYKENSFWVHEGDELYVRGFMIDYYGGDLDEKYKQWGVFRTNGKEDSGVNLIFRNISFVGPGAMDLSGNDAFCLNGCRNVWVDHCSFSDGLDGNLDIVSGKYHDTNITISWCVFSYGPDSFNHKFSNLLRRKYPERGFNVTIANCVWGGGIYTRTPFGNARTHIINCLYNVPGKGLRIENTALDGTVPYTVEGCYFAAGRNRGDEQRRYVMWNHKGLTHYYRCRDNYFANGESGGANIEDTLPYDLRDSYYIPPTLVPSVLTSWNGAGPTLTDPLSISYTTALSRNL